jgi:hypothetical protein
MISPTYQYSRLAAAFGASAEGRTQGLARRGSKEFLSELKETLGARLQKSRTPSRSGALATARLSAVPFSPTVSSRGSASAASPAPSSSAGRAPKALRYDPNVGPTIGPEDYTDEMLESIFFDAELLRTMRDPAGFMQARLARLAQPTPAVVRGPGGLNPQPLNPDYLSTRAQAQAMLEHLRELGIDAEGITESSFTGGPFWHDWGSEQRRPYEVAGMNVGALLRWYAVYPREVADEMVLAQWRRLSAV